MFKKNKPSRLPHPIPSIGCFARPPAVWEQVHWLHCWNNSPRLWSEQNSPHCPAYRGHAGHSCNTQELTQTNSTKTKSPKESQKYMSFQNETYVPAFVFQGWAVKLRKIHADSDLSSLQGQFPIQENGFHTVGRTKSKKEGWTRYPLLEVYVYLLPTLCLFELMFFLFPKWDVSSLKGMAKPKHQGPIKLMPKHLGRPARRQRLQIGPEVADSVNVGFNAIILNSP